MSNTFNINIGEKLDLKMDNNTAVVLTVAVIAVSAVTAIKLLR